MDVGPEMGPLSSSLLGPSTWDGEFKRDARSCVPSFPLHTEGSPTPKL